MRRGYFFEEGDYSKYEGPIYYKYLNVRKLKPEHSLGDFPIYISVSKNVIHFFVQRLEEFKDADDRKNLVFTAGKIFSLPLTQESEADLYDNLVKSWDDASRNNQVFKADDPIYTYVHPFRKDVGFHNIGVVPEKGEIEFMATARTILLDFVFDFYESDVFRDHPDYYQVKSKIENNPFFYALSLKYQVIYKEEYIRNVIEETKGNENDHARSLYLCSVVEKYADIYQKWIEFLRTEKAESIVNPGEKWFEDIELEVENTLSNFFQFKKTFFDIINKKLETFKIKENCTLLEEKERAHLENLIEKFNKIHKSEVESTIDWVGERFSIFKIIRYQFKYLYSWPSWIMELIIPSLVLLLFCFHRMYLPIVEYFYTGTENIPVYYWICINACVLFLIIFLLGAVLNFIRDILSGPKEQIFKPSYSLNFIQLLRPRILVSSLAVWLVILNLEVTWKLDFKWIGLRECLLATIFVLVSYYILRIKFSKYSYRVRSRLPLFKRIPAFFVEISQVVKLDSNQAERKRILVIWHKFKVFLNLFVRYNRLFLRSFLAILIGFIYSFLIGIYFVHQKVESQGFFTEEALLAKLESYRKASLQDDEIIVDFEKLKKEIKELPIVGRPKIQSLEMENLLGFSIYNPNRDTTKDGKAVYSMDSNILVKSIISPTKEFELKNDSTLVNALESLIKKEKFIGQDNGLPFISCINLKGDSSNDGFFFYPKFHLFYTILCLFLGIFIESALRRR